MRYSFPDSRRGYVGVFSALIIATALSTLTIAVGKNLYDVRMRIREYEDYTEAQHLARSCLYAATYALAIDHAYRVPATGIAVFIAMPDQICRIDSIEASASGFTVKTSGTIASESANLQGIIAVSASSSLPILTSWKDMNAI